jgi:hypothetical protein
MGNLLDYSLFSVEEIAVVASLAGSRNNGIPD